MRTLQVQAKESLVSHLIGVDDLALLECLGNAPRKESELLSHKLRLLAPCSACVLQAEAGEVELQLDFSESSLPRLESWAARVMTLGKPYGSKKASLASAKTPLDRVFIKTIKRDETRGLDALSRARAIVIGVYLCECLVRTGGPWQWHFERRKKETKYRLSLHPMSVTVDLLGSNVCARLPRGDRGGLIECYNYWKSVGSHL